jgi:hypothetical protein
MPRDADRDFWRTFLSKRRRFLDYLLDAHQERSEEDPDQDKIVAAIQSARDTSSLITPAFCVAYVNAWLRDREWWSSYLDEMPGDLPLKEAVTRLGLPALIIS